MKSVIVPKPGNASIICSKIEKFLIV